MSRDVSPNGNARPRSNKLAIPGEATIAVRVLDHMIQVAKPVPVRVA